MVIYSTFLYAGPETRRNRPPPINIVSYEKTTIDNGFTPRNEVENPLYLEVNGLPSAGLSTSRPQSPLRHHSRVGSSRGKIKRED